MPEPIGITEADLWNMITAIRALKIFIKGGPPIYTIEYLKKREFLVTMGYSDKLQISKPDIKAMNKTLKKFEELWKEHLNERNNKK